MYSAFRVSTISFGWASFKMLIVVSSEGALYVILPYDYPAAATF